MKTPTAPTTPADPVRDYLAAVEREASALPADRRQELLADLAEHIDVTRAERPDVATGEILAGLGTPVRSRRRRCPRRAVVVPGQR
ncbi:MULTISPECIES: HAAS signaling domain-containing protein [Streptomyces]|uniref:Uncharacterized protein n=1 Tax=Streptomyces coelicolor (strain ATCC BAA-471 / A3(2) / M145) TaxID=100226 RepID=Q9RD93_STRCO|nr:hypothetical protein [Streptomyces sp. SID7813]QFI42958.1 hypothetical protein FQ762_14645 [Streptomyces coelicolor A3(2)]THA81794.1 hypothetical protein E6R61_35615 [Streptomyces sp. LRa12]TYP08504.1 hypothetical protein FHV91_109162 [Streptomyces coelicolor]TYP11384.1 hypothetical protein FHV98_110162 [Streptomyces coelicolor A3(2)]